MLRQHFIKPIKTIKVNDIVEQLSR